MLGILPVVSTVLLVSSTLLAAQEPQQTPPRLLNADELGLLLNRSYPSALRTNSIKGITTARIFVTKDGSLDSTYLTTSTGSSRLDGAASNVVRGMKFSPARMNGEPVGVWFEVPIGFVEEGARPDSGALPQLLNRDDLQRQIAAATLGLKDDPEVRVAEFTLDIDATGKAIVTNFYGPSCRSDIDDLAKRLIGAAKFSTESARINGYLYAGRDTSFFRFSGDSLPVPKLFGPPPGRGPSKTTKPEIRNRDVVAKALMQYFPPSAKMLPDPTVVVWMLVDEKGYVDRIDVRESSGNCDVDNAARKVASRIRFWPAEVDGKPIKVWAQVPLVFRIR